MTIIEFSRKRYFLILGESKEVRVEGKSEKRRAAVLYGYGKDGILVVFDVREVAEKFMPKALGRGNYSIVSIELPDLIEMMVRSGIGKICLNPGIEKMEGVVSSLADLLISSKILKMNAFSER